MGLRVAFSDRLVSAVELLFLRSLSALPSQWHRTLTRTSSDNVASTVHSRAMDGAVKISIGPSAGRENRIFKQVFLCQDWTLTRRP